MDKKEGSDLKGYTKNNNSIEHKLEKQVSRRAFLKYMGKFSGAVGSIFGVSGVLASASLIPGCYSDYSRYDDYTKYSYSKYSKYNDLYSYTRYVDSSYYSRYSCYACAVYVVYYRHRAHDGPEELLKERKMSPQIRDKNKGGFYCNYFDYADAMG